MSKRVETLRTKIARTAQDRVSRMKGWLRCKRCSYEWQPRKPVSEIRICPRCKSAYWDVSPRKGN